MGGDMNLNPLKKDDNTDALVKALEDANNSGTGSIPATAPVADSPAATIPAPDASIIAADPQITGADNPLLTPDEPTQEQPAQGVTPATEQPTDTTSTIAFTGNDLPEGMSSDAEAHLPPNDTQTSGGSEANSELDSVKKSALEQLRPLIEKLDITPSDKFDKYLMMLRASDDPALIKPAYEAAAQIEGEQEKAQALLDIINEINYITSSKQS